MTNYLKKYKLAALDTNVFIYHFRWHPKLTVGADAVFNQLAQNNLKAITSLITLTELLSFRTSQTKIEELLVAFDLTPNLSVLEINRLIALNAAKIRRQYNFSLPDALQLATAVYGKAQVFITADKKLKNFKGLPVKLLS